MADRTKDSYNKFLFDFIQKDILVICPNCDKQAFVKTAAFSFPDYKETNVKFVCSNCGHNKLLTEKPTVIVYSKSEKPLQGRHLILGAAVDPFFFLPLWLTKDCADNLLWAYNREHLNFLKEFVNAKLRERDLDNMRNKSLASRLPKWMTSKKNRETVIKCIDLLATKC